MSYHIVALKNSSKNTKTFGMVSEPKEKFIYSPCERCGGDGKMISMDYGGNFFEETCVDCNGSGHHIELAPPVYNWMITCEKCSAEYHKDVKKCPNCGNFTNKNNANWITILSVFLILLSFFCLKDIILKQK